MPHRKEYWRYFSFTFTPPSRFVNWEKVLMAGSMVFLRSGLTLLQAVVCGSTPLYLSQGQITLSLKSPPPDGFEAMEFYMEYLTHYSHYAATIDALNEFNDANFPLKRYLKNFTDPQ